ncbi:hypothetical protein IVB18_44650 [Bradyrhizobium sp. 186]|uniref:hypothetical protein n=1 Tax=Bradyrhizobium sp. 186 TaxID=2782654 RepID=UPI00200099F8|nr:hypothetical protein [Bradyrhizobium sp. 186]UPK35003.1 hypothetical protein IVB18_44650 [Bradyrhizobium sp. 186]
MNDSLAGGGPLRLLFAACGAAFLIGLSGAASARVTRCDTAWVSCNNTAAKCSNDTRCMRRCDQKYIKCSGGSASLQFDQPIDTVAGGGRRS